MTLIAAMAGVLVTMGLLLARSLLGPDVFDRILAANSFGTCTVLFIAVIGFLTGRPAFLDMSLVYALVSFVGTIAVLRFIKYGGLGEVEAEREGT